MASRQTLVVVSVVLLTALAVVVPAVSASSATLADDAAVDHADRAASAAAAATQPTPTQSAENETGTQSQFGNQMTAFMQSNAAQVDDSVEDGMWEAAFERANESERARMAHARVANLDGRLAELAERNHTLFQQYQNGSISYEEYVVEASRLNGRVTALKHGLNGTARAAERAGVNTSALDELRTNARNLTGQEVAGIARGIAGGNRGPPAGVPGQGPPGENRTDRPGGPPEDAPGGPNGGPQTTEIGDAADVSNRTTATPDRGGQGNATGGPGADPGSDDDDQDGNPGNSGSAGNGSASDRGGGPSSLLSAVTLFSR